MENIRAYTIIQGIREIAEDIDYYPSDILDNNDSVLVIRKEGFRSGSGRIGLSKICIISFPGRFP